MHVCYYYLVPSAGSCATAASTARTEGANAFLEQLRVEIVAQTPQGAMSATSMMLQLLVACVCIHIVIDRPKPVKDGELWGPTD